MKDESEFIRKAVKMTTAVDVILETRRWLLCRLYEMLVSVVAS